MDISQSAEKNAVKAEITYLVQYADGSVTLRMAFVKYVLLTYTDERETYFCSLIILNIVTVTAVCFCPGPVSCECSSFDLSRFKVPKLETG